MSKGIVLSLCDYSGAWSRPFISRGYTVLRVDPMHDGGRMTTEGTTVAGSGRLFRQEDGGYALAATVGQVVGFLADDPAYFDGLNAGRVVGILAAPPCTHFAGSGARWWKDKDARGDTDEAVQIVRDCLRVVDLCEPAWWALENPVGRLERLVPELQEAPTKFTFDPCDFAGLADEPASEAYTKRTVLWGKFTVPYVNTYCGIRCATRVEPVMIEKRRKDGSVVRGSWMWAHLGGKSERTKALRSKTPTGFARAFAAAQEA